MADRWPTADPPLGSPGHLHTGCGAAWLARLSGGQEVPSSNLGSPTTEPLCGTCCEQEILLTATWCAPPGDGSSCPNGATDPTRHITHLQPSPLDERAPSVRSQLRHGPPNRRSDILSHSRMRNEGANALMTFAYADEARASETIPDAEIIELASGVRAAAEITGR